MQKIHLPKIDAKYWAALIIASILGANTGDFLAGPLGLGNYSGLPIIAVIIIVLFVVEKFDRWKHPAYFWATVVLVRTMATNIGDISSDNLHLARPLTILGILVLMGITVFFWAKYNRKHLIDTSNSLSSLPVYWWALLLAGVLGTVIGDFCSYNLPNLLAGKGLETHWIPGAGDEDGPIGFNLNNLWAALICGVPVAFLLYFGSKHGKVTHLAYYWTIVVLIRSAGTAAGDFFAHSPIGLPTSLAVSGVLFVAAILFFPGSRQKPEPLASEIFEHNTQFAAATVKKDATLR